MVQVQGLKKITIIVSGKINIGKKHSPGMFHVPDVYLLHI